VTRATKRARGPDDITVLSVFHLDRWTPALALGASLTHLPGLMPMAIASIRILGGRKIRFRSGMFHSVSSALAGLKTLSPAVSRWLSMSSMSPPALPSDTAAPLA
jgi:hypothetical protein